MVSSIVAVSDSSVRREVRFGLSFAANRGWRRWQCACLRPTVRIRRALAGAALILTIHGRPVSASLGGDAASVQTDRVRMQGALRQIVQGGAYSFHEMQSASGVVVREYLTSTGTVFGVAWQGPTPPDLRQLLGPHFERYRQEAERLAQLRKGRGPLTVDLGDLVVQSGGHSRAFSGRAYLRALVPAVVGADAIR